MGKVGTNGAQVTVCKETITANVTELHSLCHCSIIPYTTHYHGWHHYIIV